MKFSRSLALASVLSLSILGVGLFFWPFVLKEIIQPTALVLWLLLRIFVLSVDQKYYWAGLISILVVFLIRLLPKKSDEPPLNYSFEVNTTFKIIGYWRSLIVWGAEDLHQSAALRQELTQLLLSLYANQNRAVADYTLYEALKQGEIPLPEKIHSFLFQENSQKKTSPVLAFLRTLGNAPRKWLRRWSGQEAREHYQLVGEILSFMETTLEMKK